MLVFGSTADRVGGRIVGVGIGRTEAMRGRLQARAPDGESLVVDLPRGQVIHDGDTFGPSAQGTFYRVRIEPEPVVEVSLKRSGNDRIEDALRLAYTLGNHHLEVLMEGDHVYVPVIIGAEKIDAIIGKAGAEVETKVISRVISPGTSGYFAGED
ncbi:MAG TPA: hypothetical protein VLY83_02070 [Methanoregula sp.]|nr:hypothetical protein [Methanoregula sp.]